MTTSPMVPALPGPGGLTARLARRPHARAVAAGLLSLVAPGLGTALRGQVARGLAIFAGFVALALVPLSAVSVVGMATLWVWGLVTALPVPGDD